MNKSFGEPWWGKSRGAPLELTLGSMNSRPLGQSKVKKKLTKLEVDVEATVGDMHKHDFPNEGMSPVQEGGSKRTRFRSL